jgi:two-component system nitrogen regulation response regulator GlnG
MNKDDTQSTLPRAAQAPMRQERREVTLTVLAHFDVSFVGAMASVESAASLSRKDLAFTLLSGEKCTLDDPFLSRKPLELRVEGDGVMLDASSGAPRIMLDGKRLASAAPEFVSQEDLERGVVLNLADRVAVLLHRRSIPHHPPREEELGLVGVSEAIAQLRRIARKVGPTPLNVLICGETGTGKELVALALHLASERSERALETLNMATVTPSLASSELFGHNRGAFTGAERNHTGALERAHGGTLFLDEVGDTPPDIQPLLLRALESGEIRPVGAAAQKSVDVRVLAATDADLDAAIASGSFRASLLHRLSGFRVDVPPLRARREDIGVLALHFLRQELERMGASHCLDADAHRSWFSATTMARLASYDWPGNVRQLRNVTRQLAILTCDETFFGEGVDLEALLPPMPREQPDQTTRRDVWSMVSAPEPASSYRPPDEVGEEELLRALRDHGWGLAPAAKALGVSRTSLYAMIERSSKVRKAVDLSATEIEDALGLHEQDIARAALELEVSEHALKIRMKALDITS